MRRLLGLAVLILMAPGSARAQAPVPVPTPGPAAYYWGAGSIYGAPGFYGTSWGTASYRVPRTYTEYNSPYGLGYGYGYAPPTLLPGPYGVGLWRPGFSTAGYVYGAPYAYRTYPARTWPNPVGYGPPFGAYAPGFGPTPLPVR